MIWLSYDISLNVFLTAIFYIIPFVVRYDMFVSPFTQE